jgi:hypothetical protein
MGGSRIRESTLELPLYEGSLGRTCEEIHEKNAKKIFFKRTKSEYSESHEGDNGQRSKELYTDPRG